MVVRITHRLEKLAVLAEAVVRPKVLAVLEQVAKVTLVDMGHLAVRHGPAVVAAVQEQLVLMELGQEILLVMAALE